MIRCNFLSSRCLAAQIEGQKWTRPFTLSISCECMVSIFRKVIRTKSACHWSSELLENNKGYKMTHMLKAIGSVVTSTFLDKPEYDVIKTGKTDNGYEERHYKEARWVSTKVVGMLHENARSIGFQRLFSYIQGTNEKGIKIDMTTPVTTKIEPGAGPNCESTFTVSFYIPPTHQEAPPKPTDPQVFIEDRQAITVFVQQFGGFAKEETWLKEAEKLTETVQANNEKVSERYWYTAGYNSPFQMFGRTNEVWFIKE